MKFGFSVVKAAASAGLGAVLLVFSGMLVLALDPTSAIALFVVIMFLVGAGLLFLGPIYYLLISPTIAFFLAGTNEQGGNDRGGN